MKEFEYKSIYCPRCQRKVMKYDGVGKNNISVACKKCKKLVVYKPKDKLTVLEDIPPRNSSSGARLY